MRIGIEETIIVPNLSLQFLNESYFNVKIILKLKSEIFFVILRH